MPEEIFKEIFPKRDHRDKSFTYSSKGTMFKKYVEISSGDKNSKPYKFFLDISDQLIELYKDLRSNKYVINRILDQGNFKKQGYKISSDKKSVIVLDGVIFPILSTLSLYISEVEGKYNLNYDKELIHKIVVEIMEQSNAIEHGNVQTLGKSAIGYISPYKWFYRELDIKE